MRSLSALMGGLLICATLAWFGWLLVRQHNPGLSFRFPFSDFPNQPTKQAAAGPLLVAGITLEPPGPGQTALLTQEQAVLLANQMEPQAAAHASSIKATYVLLNYEGKSSALASFHNAPAWLVHYIHVAAAGPDTAADPHATNPPHDCYFFLNANNGQELFALWS